MQMSVTQAVAAIFFGNAPTWYKQAIVTFLIINPILFMFNPYAAGWALVLEFIFTLAMALKCYPPQLEGLLLIQAMFIGMTTPGHIKHEMVVSIEVILLLVFMVAGIYFMKGLLLYLYTKLLIKLKNKMVLSVAFASACALLPLFLGAFTLVAVIITVYLGFYSIYHKVASDKHFHCEHDHSHENEVPSLHREEFRPFLRNLMMHAGKGSAIGGVMTMLGEPQNLIIAYKARWDF
jgi:NhaB family Na+:H+ antiporter